MKHLGRKLLLPVAAVALAGGSFAFLASNNVDTSYAGAGQGTIAGYHVSGIHYTTAQGSNIGHSGNNNTAYITAVTFTLDNQAATSNVIAVVNEPGPGQDFTYNQCTTSDSNLTFTCTNSSAPAGGNNGDARGLAPTRPVSTDTSTYLTVLAAS